MKYLSEYLIRPMSFPLLTGMFFICAVYCAFGQEMKQADLYFGLNTPGNEPELFAPKIISIPPGVHSSAIISPDGRSILWSPMSRNSETMQSDFINGSWSVPRVVDFGLPDGISEPCFSPDGSHLYFLSFQTNDAHPVARERIWFSQKEDNNWSKARLLDDVIIAHPTHWQFSVAANFNIYFTSEIETVRGEQDIYMARYINGRYTEPEDLGPAINSSGRDLTPFIAPDESFLLFARVGNSTQKADIFISYKLSDQNWSTAIPLDNGINTAGNDLCPVVSPDGRYFFFTSQADGGYGIYWRDTAFITSLLESDAGQFKKP